MFSDQILFAYIKDEKGCFWVQVQEVVGTESREMLREKARLDARAKEEEELFARVPLSRVERKKLKQLKQSKSG